MTDAMTTVRVNDQAQLCVETAREAADGKDVRVAEVPP